MKILEEIMASKNKMPLRKNFDYAYIDLFKLFMQGEDFDTLKSFLDMHGGINATDENKRTVLMNCIIDYNDPNHNFSFTNKYAKKLIHLGADINEKDKNNDAAIHHCILSKNYEIFDILLSRKDIDLNAEPNLLMLVLNKDITNFSVMIKLIEMGFDPFEKHKDYSFYDLMKEYDDGIRTRGLNKINVKPIMEYISNEYNNKNNGVRANGV
jgi:ankyrin repeat protein